MASSHWILEHGDQQKDLKEANGHVMAWAIDCDTRQPIYILDLNQSRSGSKSNCECPSCGLPLIGVNVAKTEYVRRPHFRHPHGAKEKADCTFQAARMAALELLKSQGVLYLPSRRICGQVVGLSGTTHAVWVHRPAERVNIRDINFQDRTCAILTLDDGQEIRVVITGSGSGTNQSPSSHLPTLQFELGIPSIAALSLDELRSRLSLVPDENCWVNHWADAELLAQAEEEARQAAEELIDFAGGHASELDGVDAKFRRETLLHLECKRILQEAGRIKVPSLDVFVNGAAVDGQEFDLEWHRQAEYLELQDIKLEKRVGENVPDVIARIPFDKGGTLVIEVTVTNRLSNERLKRLFDLGIPVLEVDLSNMGGLITRKELAAWVIHNIDSKEWVYHPHWTREDQRLRRDLDSAIQIYEDDLHKAEEARCEALAIPIQDVCHRYLDAIYRGAELGVVRKSPVNTVLATT